MNRKILLFAIIQMALFLLPAICAIPQQYHYNGTIIKYYTQDLNYSQLQPILNKIPEWYFQDLQSIKLYDVGKIKAYLGQYDYISHQIYLMDGHDPDTIAHEFAHHCQYLLNDSNTENMCHTGNFDRCHNTLRYHIKGIMTWKGNSTSFIITGRGYHGTKAESSMLYEGCPVQGQVCRF